jgi:muramoyltetrapeptide carboxypeptidase
MRARGYRCGVPGVYEKEGYLAGSDDTPERPACFADPEVDAIICLRGGYGTPRLLDRSIRPAARQPKPFVGYSDITALHLAISRHAGL